MVKLILRKYYIPLHIKISEITQEYVVLTVIRNKNNLHQLLKQEYSQTIKLHFIENVTALGIDDYEEHKTRFFAITNGRPDDIKSDDEFKLYKDHCNTLLYREYIPKLIFIRNDKDIFIYSGMDIEVNNSINCETLIDIDANNSMYNSVDDVIRSLPVTDMPEETKLDYYKFRRKYDHENNNFYGSLSTFSTPIGSYLDVEIDFLLNYAKFLYESGDKKLLEFLSSNKKYQKIFDICLSDNKNTIENKTIDSIEDAFRTKNFIQTEIKNHNINLEKIENSKTEEELIEVINFPQKWSMF